jgi:hypothetical protein
VGGEEGSAQIIVRSRPSILVKDMTNQPDRVFREGRQHVVIMSDGIRYVTESELSFR